jgi:cytoskeleton protein RodZ
MPTVGEQLRQAREAQNLTTAAVAERTKIMAKNLEELEAGQFDGFAAPVYIRGFVRTYATLLHMDVKRLMADLDSELAQTEKFKEPPSLLGPSRGPLDFITLQLSKVNWRVALPVVGVVLLLLVAAWGYRVYSAHRAKDPLRQLGPGLYQPTQRRPAQVLPLTNPPPPTRR